MISFHQGNIFNATTHYIVIPVNCKGVFGAGLAKQFKNTYQDIYETITTFNRFKDLIPGEYLKYNKFILAATKDHWKNPSKKEWIVDILYTLKFYENASIALPPLGCGLGGLDKDEFKVLAKWFFSDKPNNFEIWDNV